MPEDAKLGTELWTMPVTGLLYGTEALAMQRALKARSESESVLVRRAVVKELIRLKLLRTGYESNDFKAPGLDSKS